VTVADCLESPVPVVLPLLEPLPIPADGSALGLLTVRVRVQPPGHELMVSVVAAVIVRVLDPTAMVVGSGQYVVKAVTTCVVV